MLSCGRLLPKLGISAASEGLVFLFDQFIFFKNAQLGPSLARLSIQGRICRFLWYYCCDFLILAQTERWCWGILVGSKASPATIDLFVVRKALPRSERRIRIWASL